MVAAKKKGEAPADVDPMSLDTRYPSPCPYHILRIGLLSCVGLRRPLAFRAGFCVVLNSSLPLLQRGFPLGGRAGRAHSRAQGDGGAAAALPRGTFAVPPLLICLLAVSFRRCSLVSTLNRSRLMPRVLILSHSTSAEHSFIAPCRPCAAVHAVLDRTAARRSLLWASR